MIVSKPNLIERIMCQIRDHVLWLHTTCFCWRQTRKSCRSARSPLAVLVSFLVRVKPELFHVARVKRGLIPVMVLTRTQITPRITTQLIAPRHTVTGVIFIGDLLVHP